MRIDEDSKLFGASFVGVGAIGRCALAVAESLSFEIEDKLKLLKTAGERSSAEDEIQLSLKIDGAKSYQYFAQSTSEEEISRLVFMNSDSEASNMTRLGNAQMLSLCDQLQPQEQLSRLKQIFSAHSYFESQISEVGTIKLKLRSLLSQKQYEDTDRYILLIDECAKTIDSLMNAFVLLKYCKNEEIDGSNLFSKSFENVIENITSYSSTLSSISKTGRSKKKIAVAQKLESSKSQLSLLKVLLDRSVDFFKWAGAAKSEQKISILNFCCALCSGPKMFLHLKLPQLSNTIQNLITKIGAIHPMSESGSITVSKITPPQFLSAAIGQWRSLTSNFFTSQSEDDEKKFIEKCLVESRELGILSSSLELQENLIWKYTCAILEIANRL